MKTLQKQTVLILIATVLFQPVWSQNEKITKIKTEINSAVIYLNGAEIHRVKEVRLEKGRTRVVFTGLSPKYNANNLQVSTTNNVDVLAILHKIDYLTNVEEQPKVLILKDSIELLKDNNVAFNNDRDAYKIEKAMLLENKSIGGTTNGVSMEELTKVANLFRARIMEINKAISKLDKGVEQNNVKINRLNSALNFLNAKTTYPRGEISLLLNAETASSTKIDLKYVVSDAGWIPSYDIKAKDVNLPIDINYRAKVYNNTGIDWKNLKFKLSTGDPTLSATQPKLTPWYLNYNSQLRRSKNRYKAQTYSSDKYQQSNNEFKGEGYLNTTTINGETTLALSKGKNKQQNFVEIAVSELSAEFEIEKMYSIPSDNQPYIMEVIKYNVPALFKHYSVPKLDRDAFLIARIPNWQDLNLIEGNANIYFGGTYVGQSFISTRSVSDTLNISLGRDKKVIVTRTKMEDFSSRKVIGSNKKETHAYQMIVKNNRKGPINIDVFGQVPVSQDSDIEVSTVESTNAIKNDLTGELKWFYTINPNENKTIDLTFTVKYPKSKPVKVKKEMYRSVRFL